MARTQSSDLPERLGKRVVTTLAQDLIRTGHLDPTGKTKVDILNELLDWVKNVELQLVVDYTPSILQQARMFSKQKKLEMACLFYAIWFEHWLNGIISTFAERRKLTQDEISKMIRDTNFDAKSTWMLRVLGAKPINKAHWQSMKRINDLRNAFIHYKWKAEADEVERNRERALAAVGKTIRYLRAYENRYVYSNKKRKASKTLHKAA